MRTSDWSSDVCSSDLFGDVERLDQVVVGAGIQPGDAVAGGIARGEYQHRDRVGAGAQALEHFQTVHTRQTEVEDGQLEALVAQRMQRAGAVLQPVHRVALGLECGAAIGRASFRERVFQSVSISVVRGSLKTKQ